MGEIEIESLSETEVAFLVSGSSIVLVIDF
jgi:hypothetical protein